MIDLCTVVYESELDLLRQQARSIDLYCHDLGIDHIWIMVNDDAWVNRAWWGSMQDRVQIYHRSALGTDWHHNGWVSQQVLKMLGAGMSDNVWCMILDAKTLFVRPQTLDQLLIDGRAATGSLAIYPVFEASRLITNALFDIDLPQQLGPGGVPFLVEPQAVRDMMVWIYRATGQSFADYFQRQGRLTEFVLYSGYIWRVDGSFDRRYHSQCNLYPVNLCHSEVDRFSQKFKEMQNAQTSTVSIHRHAWSQLSAHQQQQYLDLLAQRGIV